MDMDKYQDFSLRLKLAFEDVSLEALKDKVLAVLPLFQAGLLPAEKVLEILGFDDVLDQMQQIQGKMDAIKQQFLNNMDPSQRPAAPATPDLKNPIVLPTMSPKGLIPEVEQNQGINPPKQAKIKNVPTQ
jgi:hypothetical protein